jgi:hypothetical protein
MSIFCCVDVGWNGAAFLILMWALGSNVGSFFGLG